MRPESEEEKYLEGREMRTERKNKNKERHSKKNKRREWRGKGDNAWPGEE